MDSINSLLMRTTSVTTSKGQTWILGGVVLHLQPHVRLRRYITWCVRYSTHPTGTCNSLPQPPKLCLRTEAAEQPDTESAPGRKMGTEDGPKALLGGLERRGSTPVCIGETAASKPNI